MVLLQSAPCIVWRTIMIIELLLLSLFQGYLSCDFEFGMSIICHPSPSTILSHPASCTVIDHQSFQFLWFSIIHHHFLSLHSFVFMDHQQWLSLLTIEIIYDHDGVPSFEHVCQLSNAQMLHVSLHKYIRNIGVLKKNTLAIWIVFPWLSRLPSWQSKHEDHVITFCCPKIRWTLQRRDLNMYSKGFWSSKWPVLRYWEAKTPTSSDSKLSLHRCLGWTWWTPSTFRLNLFWVVKLQICVYFHQFDLSFSNGLVQPPASFTWPACLPGDFFFVKTRFPPPNFCCRQKNTSMPQSRTARPLEGLRENPEYNGEYLRERDVPKCVDGVETRFEMVWDLSVPSGKGNLLGWKWS